MTDIVARLRSAADALVKGEAEPPPLYSLLHEAAYELARREVMIHHLESALADEQK